jgi:hypothetical protein
MASFGRPDGFALVREWTAANEDERRRFLDELHKAEESRASPASDEGTAPGGQKATPATIPRRNPTM